MANETASNPEKKPEATATAPAATAGAPAASAATETVSTEVRRRKRKPGVPPRRSKKLRNHLRNLTNRLEKEGAMPLQKAVQTLKSAKRAKFDETVEVHMKLGIDTKQADQAVRGSVSLPNGTGKTVRVLVICQGDDVAKAKAGGADFVGGPELVKKIQDEGWLDFDVMLASQAMMGQVSRLGKVLGPRGLMPTPKAGTVVPAGGDVAAAVKERKAGKVDYRADAGGCVHAGVGKLSFDEGKLIENIRTFIDQVKAAKPSGVKGHFVLNVTLSATMSPGIPLSL